MKVRVSWMEVLFLALLAALMWPPSITAQELAQTSLTANLKLAINSAFTDTGRANVARRVELADANPAARIAASSAPMMAGRFELAHVAPVESVRSWRFPAVCQEDTPFSTQVRMPLVDLWRSRLQFDSFYREISADSVMRGLPQSGGVWWPTAANLTLRPATSYGIHLSFRMTRIRMRTLYGYLIGGRG